MKLKPLVVSVAILAVASAAAYLARRTGPSTPSDPRVNRPLLEAATLEKAGRLRLAGTGRVLELIRQPDGTWRVPAYYDFPVDHQKLARLAGELTEARLQRLVTSNPDRIARLEFKDTKIELLDTPGHTLWSVTLGKTPEGGGGRFVRFGEENRAYLSSLTTWLDTEPRSWARAELLDLKPDDVAKIQVNLPDGGATFSRPRKDEPWSAEPIPAGQRVKAERLVTLLGLLGNLRFSDTTALEDPNATAARSYLHTVTLETFDHHTVTIALGRKPEARKPKQPVAKPGESTPAAESAAGSTAEATPAKPVEPEYETIPAGPVFAFISHSDPAAPINELMKKRAFQVGDYVLSSLPQKIDEIFEPAPAPAVSPASSPDKTGPADVNPKG